MRKIFTILLLLAFTNLEVFAQKEKEIEPIDTTSNTFIEKFINAKSFVNKIQYINVEKVKVLNFEIVTVENLTLNTKSKGLLISNRYGSNLTKVAYLDEEEIDQLIDFVQKCHNEWKGKRLPVKTVYTFETKDNLKVSLYSYINSASWDFKLIFTKYIFDNTFTLAGSQSDKFLEALIMVKSEMKKY
jgi:hypothetical protein